MAIPFEVTDQHDFTAGELDAAAKRASDNPVVKAGMRQLLNGRVLNTKGITNRPGRSALQVLAGAGRVETILIAPGVKYRFAFTANTLKIYDATGTQIFTEGSRAWTALNVGQIVWAVYLKQVFITFPGAVPEVLSWDGTSTWTSASYAEAIFGGGQKRTIFYRISPQNITLQPGGIVGIVSIKFSSPVLVSGMISTRIRYAGRQLTILTVTSSTTGTATVNEPLPPGQVLTVASTVGTFNIGDEVQGAVSSAIGIVTGAPTTQLVSGFAEFSVPGSAYQIGDAVSGGTSGATGTVVGVLYYNNDPADGINTFTIQITSGTFIVGEVITGPHGIETAPAITSPGLVVQLIQSDTSSVAVFTTETIVGPSASATISGVAVGGPQPVSVWDQEVMNSFQGWPASCFVDQGRLGFCNFPSVPGGIAWSSIGVTTDLYVGANPSDAMFEIVPGKSQALYVAPGPESAEFVFCDNALYYIPISVTAPLKPGSVAFQLLTSDGCAAGVQPRAVQEVILYANAARTAIRALVAIGAYNRPFETRPLTDLHTHLFNNIQAIAAPSAADPNFLERYAYVLNGDGTVTIGRYTLTQYGAIEGFVGWNPWTGAGPAGWISALGSDVLFVTTYTAGANTAHLLEQLDATQYLDGSVPINAVPAALTPPGGKGPLWWLPGATVDLMLGTLPYGPHTVDANGFILPAQPGEDLTAAALRAGFTWTGVWEPFLPPVTPGQDSGQRMKKRRCKRFEVYVTGSTGFAVRSIYTGQQGPNLPALGTYMGGIRIPAYNQDDDATKPPPLREQAYGFKLLGRAHDPRKAIVKDTPGPITVIEISTEVSV